MILGAVRPVVADAGVDWVLPWLPRSVILCDGRGIHDISASEWVLAAIMATHRVLPLDGDAARVLGRMHAAPALRRLAVAPPQTRKPRFAGDLAIAATAVAHQASVATRNVADFQLIAQHCPGLAGTDPWTGQVF